MAVLKALKLLCTSCNVSVTKSEDPEQPTADKVYTLHAAIGCGTTQVQPPPSIYIAIATTDYSLLAIATRACCCSGHNPPWAYGNLFVCVCVFQL